MIIYGSKPKKNQGFLPSPPQRDERGNVLIFILIAVILLGALTMTLMRSGQSTSDTADFERLSVQASEILRYASGLELAVKSLRNRGCSENQLSFENGVVNSYSHTGSPSDNSCHIFETAGAGLTYETVTANIESNPVGQPIAGEWYFSRSQCIAGFGVDLTTNCQVQASRTDLTAILPFLNKDLCIIINRILGIDNPSGDPPQNVGLSWPSNWAGEKFRGTVGNLAVININGGTEAVSSACFEGNGARPGAGTYHFYTLLYPR